MGITTLKISAAFIALSVLSVSLMAAPFGKGTNPSKKKFAKSSISYVKEKPEAKFISKISRKAESVELNEQEYRLYNGLFYKLNEDVYEIVKAPIGADVKELPDDYQRIIMSGRVYYYTTGVFYVPQGKKAFSIVYGPIGGQISKLPEEAQPIKIAGRDYYLYHDAIFKKGASRTRKYYELFGYVDE